MTGRHIAQMHVIGSRQVGGAERFFLRLTAAMAERGHGVLTVSRSSSPLGERVSGKASQAFVGMRNGWDPLSKVQLRGLVRDARPAVVQTYMGRATRLLRLPRNSGAIHVARLGGYYKIQGYYGHADAWVGNTRGICDYLIREGLPRDRVFFIGNFVDRPAPTPPEALARLRTRLGIPGEALVVFALGRMIEKKGFDILIAAFDRLPETVGGRPLILVLAGDGPKFKQLQHRTAGFRSQSRILWVGWQTNPAPFFDMAEVAVCPSRHEPMGNVILEAWSHRRPVVATETLGATELIRNGENGLLSPVGDPERLAERLRRLLSADPAERERMGAAGFEEVARHHDEQHVVDQYLALYADIRRLKGLPDHGASP